MPSPSHVEDTLAAEEARAFTLAMRVRVVALLFIGLWLWVEQPLHAVIFFWPFLAGFLVLGIIPLGLRRAGRWRGWWPWVFPALDAALVMTTVLVPNPLDHVNHPIAQRFRFGNEVYFFALIAFSTFTYAPRLVLWQGVTSALAWIVGGLITLGTGGTFTVIDSEYWRTATEAEVIALVGTPDFVPFPVLARPPFVFLVVAGTLAAIVWRARRVVVREAHAERARTNLARYFSANLVDELASTDAPFATSRSHDCAVLFADVVGFTRLAAAEPPEHVIAFLRDHHARMERAIFDHGGTVDKYVGDGVMATFGTPTPAADDAVRALRCARAMLASLEEWNRARASAGAAPVRIGIGIAYGPVVLGDIGGPHRFEFAVLGDTVNVASRLERLTRDLGVSVVATDDTIRSARTRLAAVEAATLLDGFVLVPGQTLRGRQGAPIDVWVGPRAAAAVTTAGDRA